LLAQGFKNNDLYTYLYTFTGFIFIIQTFIAGYANLTYSIKNKRWYVLVAEIFLIGFQLTCFYLAILWFRSESYPKVTIGYYFIANFGLIAQLVLGKLTQSIKYQLISLVYFGILYAVLHFQIFNADVRFLQVASFASAAIEVALILNLYRNFQRNEIVTIKKTEA
jgi:NADH:ubiquinone oxidoreductase subunit K